MTTRTNATYTFDRGNRLRSVTPTSGLVSSYVYDGHGRRVRDIANGGSKYSQYNQAGQLMYASDLRLDLRTNYIHLGGSLVATRRLDPVSGAVATRYQHTDALGSPVVVTDPTRTVIERNQYAPYGAQISGPVSDGPGYTGHVQDTATGLTYMQQRYYDPTLGRFLSVDPVIADGNTGGNFNRYKYASNNPYKFVDPDGRRDVYIGGGGDKDGSEIVQSFAEAQQQLHPDRDIQYFSWREFSDVPEAMSKPLADGEPLNVIGHSLGGSQAIRHASDSNVKITNLITIDPVGKPVNSTGAKPANTGNWVNVTAKPGISDRSDKVATAGRLLFGTTDTSGATTSKTSTAHHGYFNTMMSEAKATETIDASYEEKPRP